MVLQVRLMSHATDLHAVSIQADGRTADKLMVPSGAWTSGAPGMKPSQSYPQEFSDGIAKLTMHMLRTAAAARNSS